MMQVLFVLVINKMKFFLLFILLFITSFCNAAVAKAKGYVTVTIVPATQVFTMSSINTIEQTEYSAIVEKIVDNKLYIEIIF